MKKVCEELLTESFHNIKNENGIDIVNIKEGIEIEDILEFVFHDKKIIVEKDEALKLQSLEGNRFENGVQCYTCGQKGHLSKDCSFINKRCQFCDEEHNGDGCLLFFCESCYNLGHKSNWCRQKPNHLNKCLGCYKTHNARDCPKVWRKYTVEELPDYNPIKTCPKCPEAGDIHFADDCPLRPEKILFFTKYWRTSAKFRYRKSQDKKFKDVAKRVKK